MPSPRQAPDLFTMPEVAVDAPDFFTPAPDPILHQLKVLVEMIELFAPSLANSGGVARAKDLIALAEGKSLAMRELKEPA